MIYDSCLCLWCSAESLRLADINYYELWHSAYALGAQVKYATRHPFAKSLDHPLMLHVRVFESRLCSGRR